MAYDIAVKSVAVEIVNRHGGEITALVMDEIRAALGQPGLTSQTVRNWIKQKPSQENFTAQKSDILSPADVQKLANAKLDDLFEQVVRRYLAHALQDKTIEATKGKEAVIAAATATDKMRLLRDLPTEIVQVLPTLMARLVDLNISASEYFNAHLQELNRAYNERNNPGG